MKRVLGVLVPALLVLAACGGDSGPGSAGSAANWCDLVTELDDNDDALESAMFNPDSMKDTFDDLGRILDRAVGAAPSEIKADVEITRRAFGQFAEVLAAADYNLMAVDESLFEDFDAELEAASDRIDSYNERVCGVTPDADDSGTSGSGGLGIDTDANVDELLGGMSELFGDEDFSALFGEDAEDLAELFGGEGGLSAIFTDQLIADFQQQGYTAAEARCLAEQFDFEALMSGALDVTDTDTIMGPFENCGISASRMAELSG